MKRKIAFSIFTMLLLISFLTISSHAALSGFATSIGTTYDGINTRWPTEYASKCYDIYGYSPSNFLMDPNYILRLSNLGAKVQYYNEHGNVNVIRGTNSGIVVGQGDDTLYVGTDKFDTWSAAGTVLVTYGACLTAGNGSLDENSITYRTALRGAQIAIGWTEKIQEESNALWGNNFNTRLAQGYGVLTAAEYANSFSYDDERVKSWHVVHHGEPNLNLAGGVGKTTASSQDEIMSYDNEIDMLHTNGNILSMTNMKIGKNTNYTDIISSVNKDFDLNDYEITKTKSGSTNVLTGETVEKEYIDLKLKVGDFITNAGYVIEIEDNNIVSIYDNNVDLNKQKIALENANNFTVNNINRNKLDEEYCIEDAIKQVSNNFLNFDVNITKTETHYYYDIKEDAKYFVVTVASELNKDNIISLSEESIYFEMN